MTILVGLVGECGRVIASDGRRVDSTGQVQSDRSRKAFRCSEAPFIFGVAGQLAPRGTELSRILEGVLRSVGRGGLNAAVEAISEAVLHELREASESQVSLQHRKADVVLIGCESGVMGGALIGVRPNQSGELEATVKGAEPGHFLTAGDDSAREAVCSRIRERNVSVAGWRLAEIRRYAEELVQVATRSAGPHPIFHNVGSCGGPPRSVRLTKNVAC